MFGLFVNTYDHYEWHDLLYVSESKEALILEAEAHRFPLLCGKEQEEAKCCERFHLVIEEVEFV